MKTHYIYIILASLILGFLLGFSLSFLPPIKPQITAQVINPPNSYTYTTAICNSNNECIDVLVECENSVVVSLTPVSGLVEFSENWSDVRQEKEKLCE